MGLHEAISWRWPGAQCVVRGGILVEWHGPMARPTDEEITQAVADFVPSKMVETRSLMRLLTKAEHKALRKLTTDNEDFAYFWNVLLSDRTFDIHHAETQAGFEFIKLAGVPSVWPDAATANARMAQIVGSL